MIDQSHVNLIDLLNIPNLKKVGMTGGGEYHGACPFCGGNDRFIVQPNSGNGGHCWCRQCGFSGDALAFVQKYYNLNFLDAAEKLKVILSDQSVKRNHQRKPQPDVYASDLKEYACFEPEWQNEAHDFAYQCAGTLWDSWNTIAAGKYLEARGITRDMAMAAFLGLNPHDYRSKWGSCDVWLPRGITIPWRYEQMFWNIRVRRSNADLKDGGDKYISPKGTANGLYRAGAISFGSRVIMTEGEFDALVLEQALIQRGIENTCAVSIGSVSGARVKRWMSLLSLADRVYIAFDDDEAGNQASAYWQASFTNLGVKSQRAKPFANDITEMWQKGLLVSWLKEIQ